MMFFKRGQEEIVGFVLIVVLVSVALLVFLGISLRQDSSLNTSDSADVYHFLESSMEFSTDCAVIFTSDFSTLGELFRNCYEGKKCLDSEKMACDVLEENMEDVLESAWLIGEDRPDKGYKFESFYKSSEEDPAGPGEEDDVIIEFEKGDCTGGSVRGASYVSPAGTGGRIQSVLEICS
jgi:hypothetical protein